ncbi:MAG: aryl-sulfate sulfotransferase [Phycisphaerales bacterium]|nr:aryl-sulfate sulfotransferase [Phycisphaerales bacterium]
MKSCLFFNAFCTYVAVSCSTAFAEPLPGWALYSNMFTTTAKLVDLEGQTVHTWESDYNPGLSFFLLENGSLLRAARDDSLPGPSGAGIGGRIQILNWDSSLAWDYAAAGPDYRQHHDVLMLPSGNILAIVWERHTAAEAIAMGRDPLNVGAFVHSETIIEIEPTGPTTGDIVWQWRAWEHMVQNHDPMLPNFANPADHPERIDINFTPRGGMDPDWLHFNAINYNEELDQLIMSANAFDEFWIISRADDSTGDLIYRWGNPAAYSMGTIDDQTLFNQHYPHWIEEGLPGAGNILIYNNGVGRPEGQYSSVDEIVLPPMNMDGTYFRESGETYGPDAAVWTCDNVDGIQFYSPIISSAQRLSNGNTFVCVGQPGDMFEVNEDCEQQWEHFDGAMQFRAARIDERDVRLRDLLWCAPDLAEPYNELNFFDVSAFLAGYSSSDPIADLDGNGIFNFFDVSAFLNAFSSGCP